MILLTDKYKKIIPFAIVFIILLSVAIIILLRLPSSSGENIVINNQNQSSDNNSSKNISQTNVNFRINSNITNYRIKPNSLNKNLLEADLKAIGLYPFSDLQYVGEPIDGVWQRSSRTISPSEVNITIYPYSDFEKDPNLKGRMIFSTNNKDNKPVVVFTSGHLNTDNKFNLPIYIDPVGFDSLSKTSISLKLSQEILLGIFLNFQAGPLSTTINYYQLIYDKLGPNIKLDLIQVE